MERLTKFDLEQKILNAWTVRDDIDLLIEHHNRNKMTDDELQKVLTGLSAMAEIRFQALFRCFEEINHVA